MAFIPALCMNTDCLTLFPSGINVTNARNITFTNCIASPCPKCGGVGKIPDGRYSEFEGRLFATINNSLDLSLFKKASNQIKRDLSRGISPKNIRKKLKKNFPAQQQLWERIPAEKRDALWYLNFIMQSLAAVAGIAGAAHLYLSDDDKNEVINNFSYEYHYHAPQPQNPSDNPAGNNLSPPKRTSI